MVTVDTDTFMNGVELDIDVECQIESLLEHLHLSSEDELTEKQISDEIESLTGAIANEYVWGDEFGNIAVYEATINYLIDLLEQKRRG